MNKVITYCIESKFNDFDKFYIDIEQLACEIVDNIKKCLQEELHIFIEFIEKNKVEDIRHEEEYIIDFLILSIFYKVYINRAVNTVKIGSKIITKNNKSNKKFVRKKVKGILSTIFLTNNTNEEVKISLNNIKKLINYLKLTDEFEEEIKRINNIYEFLKYYNSKNTDKDLESITNKIIYLGNYFEEVSKNKLSIYTINVSKFLSHEYEKHKYKEDIIYIGRLEVEYHLNMVILAIMNKLLLEEFVKSKDKILLIPPCMKFHDNYKCKSKSENYLYSCESCNKKCKVNELNKIGKIYNFKVYTFSHDMDFSKLDKTTYENKGVVCIGCSLNLINKGLKLRELNIKPQLILLSFCGCKKHWHNYGLTTRFDMNKLFEIIKI